MNIPPSPKIQSSGCRTADARGSRERAVARAPHTLARVMASASEVRQRGSGPGRDLNAARVAYDALDVDLSRVAHDAKKAHGSAEAHAGASGKYVKSLVFGGLDGIITTFAVVAASVGGSLGSDVILLMGFANLVADGLSMGFGDYLSSKAEFEYTRAEHKREKWELDVRLAPRSIKLVRRRPHRGTPRDASRRVVAAAVAVDG